MVLSLVLTLLYLFSEVKSAIFPIL